MGNPVVHWEIGSRDAARLQKFYADLFDWQVDADNAMNYGVMLTGGKDQGGIDGGIFNPPAECPPYLTMYVAVDDPAAHLKKAESLGATPIMGPMPIEGVGTIAMFKDPEGHMIGLFQPTAEHAGPGA